MKEGLHVFENCSVYRSKNRRLVLMPSKVSDTKQDAFVICFQRADLSK
jgi:hypothetical protein